MCPSTPWGCHLLPAESAVRLQSGSASRAHQVLGVANESEREWKRNPPDGWESGPISAHFDVVRVCAVLARRAVALVQEGERSRRAGGRPVALAVRRANLYGRDLSLRDAAGAWSNRISNTTPSPPSLSLRPSLSLLISLTEPILLNPTTTTVRILAALDALIFKTFPSAADTVGNTSARAVASDRNTNFPAPGT